MLLTKRSPFHWPARNLAQLRRHQANHQKLYISEAGSGMKNSEEILTPTRRTYVMAETLTEVREERQVIVHCEFEAEPGMLVRIWPSTFLVDCGGAGRAALLHAENISMAPVWTPVNSKRYRFTLVFSALPDTCIMFDLREIIPEPGGFEVKNILRNRSDVYRVVL